MLKIMTPDELASDLFEDGHCQGWMHFIIQRLQWAMVGMFLRPRSPEKPALPTGARPVHIPTGRQWPIFEAHVDHVDLRGLGILIMLVDVPGHPGIVGRLAPALRTGKESITRDDLRD